MTNEKKYKVIDHPSDIGIEAYGKDQKELFENAAYGMMDMMYETSKYEITKSRISEEKSVLGHFSINVSAENLESLLINWLSELLYLADSKKVALSYYDITKINDKELEAKVLGVKIIGVKRFIKAATYNQLEIKKEKGSWKSRIVFDV